MTDRALRTMDDDRLAAALGDLGSAIAWPTATPIGAPDTATRVRVRLSDQAATGARMPRSWWRPARRALLLALIALVLLAAVAAAVRLGLPGLRITLGGPDVVGSPPPTVAPSATAAAGLLGATMGLGKPTDIADLAAATTLPIRPPTDPAIGPPDIAWVDPGKRTATLLWASDDDLPASHVPGVGLLVQAIGGTVDDEYYDKLLHANTTLEPVSVDGNDGFWIEGAPHYFFYTRTNGGVVDDTRRWVGDALIWSDGTTTYRLETSLGRDAAIRIAESID